MRVTALCNKESAIRRTLLASLDRDAFRRFPLPLPLPDGEGFSFVPFDSALSHLLFDRGRSPARFARNEISRKTPFGVFLLISFRQPSAAADCALKGAEAEAMRSPFPCGKGDRGIGV